MASQTMLAVMKFSITGTPNSHAKQKVGQSWSKVVALGHWAKLDTYAVSQVTIYSVDTSWFVCHGHLTNQS